MVHPLTISRRNCETSSQDNSVHQVGLQKVSFSNPQFMKEVLAPCCDFNCVVFCQDE